MQKQQAPIKTNITKIKIHIHISFFPSLVIKINIIEEPYKLHSLSSAKVKLLMENQS